MSAAEDRFWQDCDASLARVRAVRAAVDETWDDPAVADDLDELRWRSRTEWEAAVLEDRADHEAFETGFF